MPYYISLAVALPFLVMGWLALRDNGVSASDGGFLQTLMTTSVSKELHLAAEKGSAGGEENVPEELKRLKIMFGELQVENGETRVGFGVEDEVVSIRKGGR